MARLELKTSFRSSALYFVVPGGCAAAEPQTLTQAVQAAVQKLDESTVRPVARRFASLAFRPKVMLALLTYCYARQIYSSREIEGLLARDNAFCEACRGDFPGAGALSQFRNENRQALRACLAPALLFLAGQKVNAGVVTKVNEACVAEEANRRLIMGLCIDSLELPGEQRPWEA